VRRKLLVFAALAALAVPAPASSRRVSWQEAFTAKGAPLVTFTVTAVTIRGRRWSVSASVKNTWTQPISLARNYFGLRFYRTRRAGPATFNLFRRARHLRPAFPTVLQPGQSWTGGFSGRGRPGRRWRWVRVSFGSFRRIDPSLPPIWSWITDHTARL
jgi:hypothetical protein